MPCPHCTCVAGADADGDFARLDADFVRVLEDVIDTLIARNVINITHLPDQAQAKLFARKSYRDRIGRNALHLYGDALNGDMVDGTPLTTLF